MLRRLAFLFVVSTLFFVARSAAAEEREVSKSAAVKVTATISQESPAPPAMERSKDGKPRIIVFGAHPDDSEIRAGGSAALWSRRTNNRFVTASYVSAVHVSGSGELPRTPPFQVLAIAATVFDL